MMWNNASKCEIPCALHHRISLTNKKMDKLSSLECQQAFQYWVAYIRPSSSGVSMVEQYTCPLLSCNTFHCDLESFLTHITTCPRLDTAEYWCADCLRFERFPMCRESDFAGQRNAMQRTGSKLKRAVVQTFSIRSSSRNSDREPCLATTPRGDVCGVGVVDECKKLANSKFELGSTPPTGLELPAGDYAPPQYLEKSSTNTHHELAAVLTPGLSFGQKRSVEGFNKKSRDGPDNYNFVGLQDSGYNSPIDSIYRSGDTFTSQQSPTTEESQSLAPTSSPLTAVSAYLPELESSLTADLAYPGYTSGISELAANRSLLPSSRPSTTRAVQLYQSNSTTPLAVDLPTQRRVKELRNVFRVRCNEWMVRLSFTPDLLMSVPGLSADALFVRSLQTWQSVVLGQLPGSFEAIFAFILAAVACAYILHEDSDTTYWDELRQNAVHWRYAIADPAERETFAQIIREVMAAPRQTGKTSPNTNIPSTFFQSTDAIDRRASHHPPYDGHVSFGQVFEVESPFDESEDIDELLHRLQKGRAMTSCSRFLDDVAYAEVSGRSMSYGTTSSWYTEQHVVNIEDMRRSTTWELRQHPEMQCIRDQIMDTDKNIQCGMLRSVREVEVTLLEHCKMSCSDSLFYYRCRSIIAQVCNKAMVHEEPHWRAHHYAADLDTIMASASGSQLLPAASSSSKHLLDRQPPSQVVPTTPPVYSKGFPETTPGHDTPLTTIPAIPADDLLPAPLFSRASPHQSSATRQCSQCGRSFTTSNLSRHIQTHQPREGSIPCRIPCCGSVFTRQDNADRHMRSQHSDYDDPATQQPATKRRNGRLQAVSKRRKVTEPKPLTRWC